MKKTVSLLLTIIMTLSLCCPAVFAASLPEMTFELSCDGTTAHTRPDGSVENALENFGSGTITVYYTISAARQTTAVATQNKICYDGKFFELVEDSVKKGAEFSGYYVEPGDGYGNQKYILINTINNYTYGDEKQIASFQLRIKNGASGSSVIRNTNYAAAQNLDKYPVSVRDLWVGFGEWDSATFQVTLDTNGGALPTDVSENNSVNTEKGGFPLPTPTKQYYTFDGWYTQSGQKCGATFTPTEDTTLTAHWTVVPVPAAPKEGINTVKASGPDESDGKITGVTTAMEYTASKLSVPIACTGTTIGGLKAGTYYVRLKENPAANTPAGEYAEVRVEAWPLRDAPSKLSGTKASSAVAEDGKILGTTTEMEYSRTPDDEASFKPCSADETTGLKAGVYFVRYVFDTVNNRAPSEAAQVRVPINGPAAPTEPKAVKPSKAGKADGKITGVKPTMEYSTDPDFTTAMDCPDGEITGLEGGKTYYIRLKADPANNTLAGNYAVVEVPKGDAPGSSSVTQTAGGKSSDLTVKATVSEDSVATLSSVSDADIKAAAAATESGLVGIDLSRGKEPVEAAKLPAGMIGKIASAVNKNGKGGFALKLTSANLEFDAKALQSLANQAKSGELQISMLDTGTMAFNDAQYEAIRGMSLFGGYNVSAAVGSKSISQFGGGNIKISIPFNIPNGRYAEGFCAYYVAPDGKLTRLATTYQGGMINFSVDHFSDYIIAYSEDNIGKTKFVDVVPGEYYEDPVAWAVSNGITTGTSATTFSPDVGTTRAQVVTFLWRAAGKPTVNYAMSFRDVPSDYYTEAVRWAVSKGITDGTSADTFSPNAVCTRAQIVTFLWRAADKPTVDYAMNFRDVASDYYTEAVRWAVSKGITSGITPTTFLPDATCTRAQVVTFLYRSMK